MKPHMCERERRVRNTSGECTGSERPALPARAREAKNEHDKNETHWDDDQDLCAGVVRKGYAFGCVEATPRWSGCHDTKHGGMCVHAATDQGVHTSQVKPRGGIGKESAAAIKMCKS